MEKNILTAFSDIIVAQVQGGNSYHQIMLNDKPAILGNVRVYKTSGAAKAAMKKAIYVVLWNFEYWSKYSDNIAKRNGLLEAELRESFYLVRPIFELTRTGNTNHDSIIKAIKREAEKVYLEMEKAGIVRIEKMQ